VLYDGITPIKGADLPLLTRLQFLCVIFLGLFSGAMLFIATCIAPYWAALAPDIFRENFRVLGPFVGDKMVPLMGASILLSALCSIFCKADRSRWIVVFGLVVLIVPTYLVVHAPINELFLGPDLLSPVELLELRRRWITWHWARTFAGLSAFGIAVINFRNVK
jgi:hypothetical protein